MFSKSFKQYMLFFHPFLTAPHHYPLAINILQVYLILKTQCPWYKLRISSIRLNLNFLYLGIFWYTFIISSKNHDPTSTMLHCLRTRIQQTLKSRDTANNRISFFLKKNSPTDALYPLDIFSTSQTEPLSFLFFNKKSTTIQDKRQ